MNIVRDVEQLDTVETTFYEVVVINRNLGDDDPQWVIVSEHETFEPAEKAAEKEARVYRNVAIHRINAVRKVTQVWRTE